VTALGSIGREPMRAGNNQYLQTRAHAQQVDGVRMLHRIRVEHFQQAVTCFAPIPLSARLNRTLAKKQLRLAGRGTIALYKYAHTHATHATDSENSTSAHFTLQAAKSDFIDVAMPRCPAVTAR
jgi:hypothetical protein